MSMVHAPLPATKAESTSASVAGGRRPKRGLSLAQGPPLAAPRPRADHPRGAHALAARPGRSSTPCRTTACARSTRARPTGSASRTTPRPHQPDALDGGAAEHRRVRRRRRRSAPSRSARSSPLLLARLGTTWRVIVSSCIMVAWAMPAVTGTYVWTLIFDADRGIFNDVLMEPRPHGRPRQLVHEPVVVLRDRAAERRCTTASRSSRSPCSPACSASPRRCWRPPSMDGAGAFRRFLKIIFPTLRQVFSVVIILSTIWDFKVFAQVYLMPGGAGSNRSVLNLGVWSYVESFGQNRYGFGSALAVLLTLVLIGITIVYIRSLMKEDETVNPAPHCAPVPSQLGKASRSPRVLDRSRCSPCTGWCPAPSTRGVQRRAVASSRRSSRSTTSRSCSPRAGSACSCATPRSSRSCTVLVRALVCLLAAVAVARFRFKFRTTVLMLILVVQMVPLEALVIPLFVQVEDLELLEQPHRSDDRVRRARAAVRHLDAARLRRGRPGRARGGRVHRRRELVAHVPLGPAAAGGARPRRDEHLQLHHRVERVHLRDDDARRRDGEVHGGDRPEARSSACTPTTGAASWRRRRSSPCPS